MVNTFTNVSKTNNCLSPQIIEDGKRTTTYCYGNPCPEGGYNMKL